MKIKHITNGSLVNASNVAKYDVNKTLFRFPKKLLSLLLFNHHNSKLRLWRTNIVFKL